MAARQQRPHRDLKIYPEGTGTGLPLSFELVSLSCTQQYDGRSRMWLDMTPRTRTVLAGGITRAEAVALIGELADWLAWDGKDGA